MLGRILILVTLTATFFLISSSAWATPPDPSQTEEVALESREESQEALTLEPIRVEEKRVDPASTLLSKEKIQSSKNFNLGEAVESVSGVHAVRRSASATEPVIRGLGWERVSTQMNFMPIHGACPARMDPPITYAKPGMADEVMIVKGLPSVTLGAAGPGGRVMVRRGISNEPPSSDDLKTWSGFAFDGARNGLSGDVGMKVQKDKWDLELNIDARRAGDYKSASGVEVPSSQKSVGLTTAGSFQQDANQKIWSEFSFSRDQDINFPALPMDTRYSNNFLYLGRYTDKYLSNELENLELDFGFNYVDHQMDNRDKPNRGTMEASTDSKSQTISFRGLGGVRLRDTSLLNLGLDMTYLMRDALRTRTMVASGMTAQDHLWPDATQWNLGIFNEWKEELTPDLSLRIGGRFDLTRSTAGAIGDSSLLGANIADNYAAFNGTSRNDIDRFEYTGSGNLQVSYRFQPDYLIYTGGGLSSRPAGITERYFAFAPAPGGFQIGNPGLSSEKKYEVEGGFKAEKKWLSFEVSGYVHWVDDYIVSTSLATQDVNGDGNPDLIRGFDNVLARLYGFETGFHFRPTRRLSFPLTLSYVRGQNLEDNTNLPEIPPFEGRIAARYEKSEGFGYFGEFGARFVAAQTHVDPNFPEDPTGSYEVVHLRGGISPIDSLHIEFGVENLLDRNYNDHLTREALLAVGGLAPGDEVLAPGRSFNMGIRYTY